MLKDQLGISMKNGLNVKKRAAVRCDLKRAAKRYGRDRRDGMNKRECYISEHVQPLVFVTNVLLVVNTHCELKWPTFILKFCTYVDLNALNVPSKFGVI